METKKEKPTWLQGVEKIITKALISEVLDIPVPANIELTIGNKFNNNVKQTLRINYNDGSDSIEFNIYELVHECKEWALDNKYIIHTTPLLTEKKNGGTTQLCWLTFIYQAKTEL